MSEPRIGILMGSDSDWPVMEGAATICRQFDVLFEAKVMSAHRTPEDVAAYASTAYDRGTRVMICGAGMAAHLAGAVAAQTSLPVIGVPIASKQLDGMDALLATVQMPPGVPVATVAIGGAKNAALLAIQILATGDAKLWDALQTYKVDMATKARAKTLPDPGNV
jgi:5-(carboxyamino)imidazole ribonucleotide mutase